jgi:hypothetical protein
MKLLLLLRTLLAAIVLAPALVAAQSIDNVSPSSARRGELLVLELAVTDVAAISSVTIADFVTGFSDRRVDGSGTVLVDLAIPDDAPRAPYDVVLETADGQVTSSGGFAVVRRTEVTSVSPAVLPRGARATLAIEGFDLDGFTSAAWSPAGIEVTTGFVSSPNRVAFGVAVADSAALGPRDLALVGDGRFEVPALLAIEAGEPGLLFFDPGVLARGASATVTLGGRNLDTVTGLDLGPGIAVSGWTPRSATRATASVSVGASALAGARSADLLVGTTRFASPPLFTVTGGEPRASASIPAAIPRGVTTRVELTGENLDRATEVSLGSRVAVTALDASNPTRIRFDATPRDDAPTGPRDITLLVDGTPRVLTALISVSGGPLEVQRVRPDRIERERTTLVTLEGLNLDGITSFDAGPGVTTVSIRASDPTAATVSLAVAPDAATGLRTATIAGTHGTATLRDLLTVVPRVAAEPRLFFREEVILGATQVGARQDSGLEIENGGDEDETVIVGPGIGDTVRLQLLTTDLREPVSSVSLRIPAGSSEILRFRYVPIQPGTNGVLLPVTVRDGVEVGRIALRASAIEPRLTFGRASPDNFGSLPPGTDTQIPTLSTTLSNGAQLRTIEILGTELTLTRNGEAVREPGAFVGYELVSVSSSDLLYWGSTEVRLTVTPEVGSYEGRLVFETSDPTAPYVIYAFAFRAVAVDDDVSGDTGDDDIATDTGADTDDAGPDGGDDAGDTTAPPDTDDTDQPDTLPGDTGTGDTGGTGDATDVTGDTGTGGSGGSDGGGCSASGGAGAGLAGLAWITGALLARARRRRAAAAALLGVLAACDDSQTAGGPACERGFRLDDEGDCVPATVGDTGDPGDQDTTNADDATGGDQDTTNAVDTVVDTTVDTASCAEGSQACSADGVPQRCESGVLVDQAPCAASEVCRLGRCVAGESCEPEAVRGCLDESTRFVCNAAGTGYVGDPCDEGQFCFEGICGSQRCAPDARRCAGDFDVESCTADGTAWQPAETCDRRSLRVCEAGECVSGCVAAAKDPSYIGCEYWSVDLPQYPDPLTNPQPDDVPHSVVLANVGDYAAEVTVSSTDPAFVAPRGITIAPRSTGTLTFPVASIADTGITARSFRISTTEPVVAYQFSPLNNVGVFSNDASLLLPASALGTRHRIMGYGGGIAALGLAAQRSWFTVVGTTNRTEVTVTLSARAEDGGGLTNLVAGVPRTFTLDQGQVLNFAFSSTFGIPPVLNDPTGSLVVSNHPVVVFAGHEEAVIGEEGEGGSNCCADHLQEQMFPVGSWRTAYSCVHSPPRGTEPDVWRVVADTDGTRLTTQPSIAGLDGVTLNAGEFVEASTPVSFELQASAPVLVGQYLVSQQSLGVERYGGDPALILMVPSEQFRENYTIQVPAGYSKDFLTVVKPAGVEVRLDGTPIPESSFEPFGTRTWSFAHIEARDGAHQLESSQPFGLYGYGYDSAVSYGYSGGLDLGVEEPTIP